MAGFFNVPSELVKVADEATVGFTGLSSAVYRSKILAVYIVESSNSSSKALTIQYQVPDSDRIHYESLWYQESRGLNTYSCKKTGSEKLLPSFTSMLDFFAAAGVDIDKVVPEPKTVKHFGTDGTYPTFMDFAGKVIDLGIRHLLKDDYKNSTDVDDTHTIQLFANLEGKSGGELRNAKNAYTVDGWKKMIAKKPTLDQRKDSKGGASAAASSESVAAPKASW